VVVTSFLFLLLGGVYLLGSLELAQGTVAQPGTGFYPRVVGVVMIGLSLYQLLRALTQKEMKADQGEPFLGGKDRQRIWMLVATLILFTVLLRWLGYLVCSSALVGILLPLLGMKSWVKIVAVTLLTASISYYFFSYLLGVPLPRGSIFS
jgi:putative tricarboxylic transport membrane protein